MLDAGRRERAASSLLSCPLFPLLPWFSTSLQDLLVDAPVLLVRDLRAAGCECVRASHVYVGKLTCTCVRVCEIARVCKRPRACVSARVPVFRGCGGADRRNS